MLVVTVLLTLTFAGNAFSQASETASNVQSDQDVREEAQRRQKDKTKLPLGQLSEVRTVCAEEVPHGWIKTNDRWDPALCGKPTMIMYNFWTIERYKRKPVGSLISACSVPIPRGWTLINDSWNPTKCDHPTALIKNVMMIKRVE